MPRLRFLLFAPVLLWSFTLRSQTTFSPMEQQKISIETAGLFEKADSFLINFNAVKKGEYSFPLPLGKAVLGKDNNVEITTTKGDAVKAMFDGVVRMSWDHPRFGKVVVIRHPNGLETVYGRNIENRVKVGEKVKAGQTVAIVGGSEGRVFCEFAIMVNGGRINPQIVLNLQTHSLMPKVVLCKRKAFSVEVTTVEPNPWDDSSLAKEKGAKGLGASNPFGRGSKFTLHLSSIPDGEWCYPLPKARLISRYGGRNGRRHTGVDLKTKPNDPIYAAFDGVVIMSQVYSGYGNCIVIRHLNGLETLYSHNSKNLVKVGQNVKCGQKIALTGRTGRATTEHLHFEVRVNGRPYNPDLFFNHVTYRLRNESITFYKNGAHPSLQKNSPKYDKTSVHMRQNKK